MQVVKIDQVSLNCVKKALLILEKIFYLRNFELILISCL